MYSLKVILAVWTAVFLALPSCPCQLFEALGIDFPHRHTEGYPSEVSRAKQGPLSLDAGTTELGKDLPLCHCQDSLSKTAEECEGEELVLSSKLAVPILDLGDVLPSRSEACSFSARAPPPQLLLGSVLTCPWTGVYRL